MKMFFFFFKKKKKNIESFVGTNKNVNMKSQAIRIEMQIQKARGKMNAEPSKNSNGSL